MPARIWGLRSTFAVNVARRRDHGVDPARVMGTSVEMIERHYGAPLDGSGASTATRLGLFEAEKERAAVRPITEAE
jgi:hypothetical protein